MSGVAVMNHVLSNFAALNALVPGARIFSGPVPLNADGTVASDLPAIGIKKIDGTEFDAVDRSEPSVMKTERVQVTVYAANYDEKAPILNLIGGACRPKPSSPVNGVRVGGIMPAGEGPDLDDWEAKIFEQSRDFFVKWIQA